MSKTAIKTSNFENRLRCYRFDDKQNVQRTYLRMERQP